MDCRAVQFRLAPFLAGELAEPEGAALRAHMAGCAACRARLAQEQRLNVLLAAPELRARCSDALPPPPPLPRGFTDQVMARIAALEGATPPRRVWRSWFGRLAGPWVAGGAAPNSARLQNLAFAVSACLVVSAGSLQFLRAPLRQAWIALTVMTSGIWADVIVWTVQHMVHFRTLVSTLLSGQP